MSPRSESGNGVQVVPSSRYHKVVQELLGHSTIAMTADIYSHLLPSMQQDAMERLDEQFRKEHDR